MNNRLSPTLFAALTTLNLVLLTVLSGAVGCKDPTIIGTLCKKDGDCNIAGQVCAPGFSGGPSICTRKCTSSTGANGCPIGYDCYPTDAAKGATCNKVRYEIDAAGNPLVIGADCSLDDNRCTTLGSTNGSVGCRKIPDESQDPPVPVASDPNAFCTVVCESDGDCPLAFKCATDYQGNKLCLRRTFCDVCAVDENCPEKVCVSTTDGKERYCTKTCASTNDCGGVQNTALYCSPTKNAAGGDTNACLHRFGACVGEGNICDPCRTKADCAKTSSFCVTNSGSLERFCTKSCADNTDCEGGTVPSICDNTDIPTSKNPYGESYEICLGADTQPGQLTCYALPL